MAYNTGTYSFVMRAKCSHLNHFAHLSFRFLFAAFVLHMTQWGKKLKCLELVDFIVNKCRFISTEYGEKKNCVEMILTYVCMWRSRNLCRYHHMLIKLCFIFISSALISHNFPLFFYFFSRSFSDTLVHL